MNIQIREYSSQDKNLLKKSFENISQETFSHLTDSRYGKPFSPEEVIKIIDDGNKIWLAFDKDNLLGFGELSKQKQDGYCELGYLVFPAFQKLGIGYKLASYIITFASKSTNYKKIKAEAEITNVSSLNLLKKLAVKYKPQEIKLIRKYNPNTTIYYWNFRD